MATIPTAAALDLMYRSSTTGAPTAEFNKYGGYAAVKAAAEAAGYSATPEFIQSYEVAQGAAAPSPSPVPPTPTSRESQDAREELERQTRINDNLRQQERYFFEKTREAREASERQIAAQQAAEQQAAAQQVAAQQAAAQQAAAQQAAAAQAQQQIAAQYASAQQIAAAQAAQQAAMQAVQSAAQARSTGLLDVAPRAAATAGPAINRPTAMMQPSYTQDAPAQITNRAITGTPYSSIYSPATMRQNAPTLANVQAAARSANPYASLMALSQQQFLPGSYAGLAGATAANPYLGGYNPNIYQLPPATGLLAPSRVSGYDGVNNSGDQRGPGSGNAGGGQTFYGSLANLAGEAQRAGFTTIGDFLGGLVPVGAEYNRVDLDTGSTVKGATTQADIDALSGKNDPGSSVALSGSRQDFRAQELAAQNLAERNAFTAAITGLLGQSNTFAREADALPGTTTNAQPQGYDTAGSRAEAAAAAAAQAAAENAAIADANIAGYEGNMGDFLGGSDSFGEGQYAKGGMVNMKPQRHNPPGPDDGYAALDNGEYVIRKKAVKKYGANIFDQINAGRIPAQRLKSLLE